MNASASVRVNGELSASFNVEVGVRQGCVMSPWLFNIYMDGIVREIKVRVWDLGSRIEQAVVSRAEAEKYTIPNMSAG